MTCLEQLGLTSSAVRLAAINAGATRPAAPQVENSSRYVAGDQRAVWDRVRRAEPAFFALALMYVPAAKIGAIEGVSGECVLRRLRPAGLAKRGRPRVV